METTEKRGILSLEKMLHLRELGFDLSDAHCCYYTLDPALPAELRMHPAPVPGGNDTCIPAFDISDAINALPGMIRVRHRIYRLIMQKTLVGYCHESTDPTEDETDWTTIENVIDGDYIGALYELLLWTISEGHVQTVMTPVI